MASLRQLLDVASVEQFTIDKTMPAWLENNEQSFLFSSWASCCYETDYNNTEWCCWEITSDMTSITFEIWGAGGGGAGSCCCAWGPPGGAGAYALKVLDNSDGTYTNECYCLCAPSATCCSPTRTCGYRGCRAFIVGPGLSNFCAEGGHGGCSFCDFFGCFPNNGCGIVMHPNADTECACYFGADSGVPGRHGGIEANCCNASTWCHYKTIFALPGGFGRTDVAYMAQRKTRNAESGYCGRCRIGSWTVSGVPTVRGRNGHIGTGGATASACSGGCCCGSPGGPGLIKISWS